MRLVLLPCALRLGGRFTWWRPRWLAEPELPAAVVHARAGDGVLVQVRR